MPSTKTVPLARSPQSPRTPRVLQRSSLHSWAGHPQMAVLEKSLVAAEHVDGAEVRL
jgi:hypothetical protein